MKDFVIFYQTGTGGWGWAEADYKPNALDIGQQQARQTDGRSIVLERDGNWFTEVEQFNYAITRRSHDIS